MWGKTETSIKYVAMRLGAKTVIEDRSRSNWHSHSTQPPDNQIIIKSIKYLDGSPCDLPNLLDLGATLPNKGTTLGSKMNINLLKR